MPIIKVQINPLSVISMKQRDISGRTIPTMSTIFSNYYLNLFLFIDNKKIGMACRLEIRNQNEEADSNQLCAIILKNNLSNFFTINPINLFNVNQFYFSGDIKAEDEQVETEFEIEINESFYNILTEQSKKYFQFRDDFNFCVDKLMDFADYNYLNQYSEKIQRYLQFIHTCKESANYGNLQGWYNEKYSTVHSSFEELLKRKNANNSTYLYHVESIKRILFNFKAPEVWESLPSDLIR